MKKYISILTAMALILTMSINIVASQIDEQYVEYDTDATDDVTEEEGEGVDIDSGDYLFLFGTTEAEFLYDYALQYRIYTYIPEYKDTLGELFEDDGNYYIPVSDSSGNCLGYAECSMEEDGSWHLISVSQGDTYELLYELTVTGQDLEGFTSAFLGGDPFNISFGIILTNGTEEAYFDLYSYGKALDSVSIDSDLPEISDYLLSAEAAMDSIVALYEEEAERQASFIENGFVEPGGYDSDSDYEVGGEVEENTSDDANPTTGAVLALMMPAVAIFTALSSKKRK